MRLLSTCLIGLLALPFLAPPLAGQVQAPFAVPAIIGDGWQAAEPGASGFDAARLHAVLATMMKGEANLHSVIVERHGRLVAELYGKGKDKGVYSLFTHSAAFGPTARHDTRSVGKSVVSLLLGVAQQQGRIKGLATPVLDFYPEYKELATPERKAITLEHLLTMSSGFQWNEGGEGPDDEHRLYWKWSPYFYVLSRPISDPPGSRFNYNSGGTALLADILGRTTKMPFKEFARNALFEPMGIRDWEWVSDIHGRPMAFTGLRMRPRDMAKLGRLVLDKGQWQGRQLVPSEWIAASLQPRITTNFDGIQYGYFWWTGTVAWQGQEHRWAAAFGNGAQRIFVVPDLDLCVVVTAGAYGDIRVARQVNAWFKEIVATVQP